MAAQDEEVHADAGDPRDWHRQPGAGHYARPERERRFLLRADPPPGAAARTLEDRYLEGTRLRLRHVSDGERHVWKLTQKVRVREDDPSEVLLTNTYLTEQEHALLRTLPCRDLRKTRTVHRVGEQDVVVDVFCGRWEGLRLAELEVRDLAAPVPHAAWLGEEVTHDDRWSGGALAHASDDEVRRVMTGRRAPRSP